MTHWSAIKLNNHFFWLSVKDIFTEAVCSWKLRFQIKDFIFLPHVRYSSTEIKVLLHRNWPAALAGMLMKAAKDTYYHVWASVMNVFYVHISSRQCGPFTWLPDICNGQSVFLCTTGGTSRGNIESRITTSGSWLKEDQLYDLLLWWTILSPLYASMFMRAKY